MQKSSFVLLALWALLITFILVRGDYSLRQLSRDVKATERLTTFSSFAVSSDTPENGMSWKRFCAQAMMFDDNLNVINTLTNNGLTVHNAISLNEALGA